MSDKIKKQYNTVLERVEVANVNGKFVVIDSHGRVHGRWSDEHHARLHSNLINSLIDGADKSGNKKGRNNQGFRKTGL